MPDSLQYRIDQVALLNKERLTLQKEVDKMKAEVDATAAAIATEMRTFDIEELNGDVGYMRLKTTESAMVTSYPDFYQYIHDNNAFDLLQRRVSLAGVRERWQEGNEVPGVARVLEDGYTLGI